MPNIGEAITEAIEQMDDCFIPEQSTIIDPAAGPGNTVTPYFIPGVVRIISHAVAEDQRLPIASKRRYVQGIL